MHDAKRVIANQILLRISPLKRHGGTYYPRFSLVVTKICSLYYYYYVITTIMALVRITRPSTVHGRTMCTTQTDTLSMHEDDYEN